MSKRIVKELTGMAIDEISLVDRGANADAVISFAKSRDGVNDLFTKARHTDSSKTGDDKACVEEHSGDDPADVVDEYVSNDGKGDTGAPSGKTISGTQKVSGEDITGKAGKAKTRSVNQVSSSSSATDDENVESKSSSGKKNLPMGLKKSDDDFEDDEIILAKALGLIVDAWDEDVEKGFGPPQPSPFQPNQQPPQFGAPPMMQTGGAQPFGMGAPQAPAAGAPGMMPGGMPGAMPTMGQPGMPQMPGQGAPPQLGVAQLPPEAVAYIQQLEQKIAQLQGNGDSGDSSESSDSSSSGGNSDSSNKPFGKSGDFDVDQNAFLEELSKAIRDEDRGEFSKALQARFEAYETEISEAQEIAKAERDLRLEREFISKAEEFDVPVAANELGPVLKRAAESLSEEDFSVIVKCLDAATETASALYGEIGKRGTGLNGDVFAAVQAEAEALAKNATGLSNEQATAKVFETNPAAYDEYLASRRGR